MGWFSDLVDEYSFAGIAQNFMDPAPSAPSAPQAGVTSTAMERNAADQIALGREGLAFTERVYNEGAPRREAELEAGRRASEQQFRAGELQLAAGQEYLDYFRNTFKPLEQEIVTLARNYDTPQRREEMAGEAVGEVKRQFGATRSQNERNMAQYGVNPIMANARYGVEMDAQEAAASAQAGNQARRQVEETGFNRRVAAAGMGRNLPVVQNAAAGTASGAFGGSTQSALAGGAGARADAAGVMGGYGVAMGGYTGANTALNQQFGTQARLYGDQLSHNANMNRTYGDVETRTFGNFNDLFGGIMGGMMSSPKAKKDVEPIRGALSAVERTPSKEWQYNERGFGAEFNDGNRHMSPMADELRENAGVGDGVMYDQRDHLGLIHEAVRELSAKVDQLSARR